MLKSPDRPHEEGAELVVRALATAAEEPAPRDERTARALRGGPVVVGGEPTNNSLLRVQRGQLLTQSIAIYVPVLGFPIARNTFL